LTLRRRSIIIVDETVVNCGSQRLYVCCGWCGDKTTHLICASFMRTTLNALRSLPRLRKWCLGGHWFSRT